MSQQIGTVSHRLRVRPRAGQGPGLNSAVARAGPLLGVGVDARDSADRGLVAVGTDRVDDLPTEREGPLDAERCSRVVGAEAAVTFLVVAAPG